MATASVQHADGLEVVDSVSEVTSASLDLVSCNEVAGNDGSRGNVNSLVELDFKPVASSQFYTENRLAACQSKSVGQSLPSLPKQDSPLPNCSVQLSVSCYDLPLQIQPGEVSSTTEIPSTGISTVVVEDCGISICRESCVSSSAMNLEISDTDTVTEMNMTFVPFCRICQLSGDSASAHDSTLMSPCRCSGSLQYTHTACLVVSYSCVSVSVGGVAQC